MTVNHQGYGFVEFLSEEDADYAIKIMNMIKLYGKPIRVNKVRDYLDPDGSTTRLSLSLSPVGICTSKESGRRRQSVHR